MRTIDNDHLEIIRGPQRRVDLRVQIEDGDATLQDMSDFKGHQWVIRCDIGDDIDATSSDATITLMRSIYHDSLAPFVQESRTNLNASLVYDPILDLGREVVISARFAAGPDAAPLAWIEIFRGAIDEIRMAKEELQLVCRDQMRVLQDTYIESTDLYSITAGTAVETILQEIIDDWIASPPTLYVPTSPMWNVTEFNVQKQSVADQIKLLVDQFGWTCKYKWDSGTSAFRLTLYTVDRAAVDEDIDFGPTQYYSIEAMDLSIKDVRNAVTIIYPDSAIDPDEEGNPIYSSITLTEPTSVTLYGRRWMSITEAASSIIDSSAEATIMGEAILADLQIPKLAKTVDMPFFPFIDIGDIYEFTANGVTHDINYTLAVVGYRHYLSEDDCRTTVYCRGGSPAGQVKAWFDIEAVNGNAPKQMDHLPNITKINSINASSAGQLIWEDNTAYGPLLEHDNGPGRIHYEIYVTLPGGTPAADDLYGTTRSRQATVTANSTGKVPIDTLLDVHVRAVNKYGKGSFIVFEDVRANPMGSAGMSGSSTVFNEGINSNFNEQTKGTGYPIDGWEMATGTWDTDALMDDGTTFTGATSQYGTNFLVLK